MSSTDAPPGGENRMAVHAENIPADAYPWLGIEDTVLPLRQVVLLALAMIGATLLALLVG
jgi:hypothetical protein